MLKIKSKKRIIAAPRTINHFKFSQFVGQVDKRPVPQEESDDDKSGSFTEKNNYDNADNN